MSSGLRRLRELRNEGWIIEKRRIEGSRHFEYRIVTGCLNCDTAVESVDAEMRETLF